MLHIPTTNYADPAATLGIPFGLKYIFLNAMVLLLVLLSVLISVQAIFILAFSFPRLCTHPVSTADGAIGK